ncbi:hypothetical protein LVX13_36760 [Streptomyces albulus]|uniref:CBS domain-containing protein n=1 Tax=Streptomyces noursei TaxID=1971 RepID=UPI001F39603C|nr:CBS domain-containing protein [Streptomyces noursei]MCE4948598.1 hypothetical protein [Streptomyces noursei]MCZ0975809.1 hypothetical protein [Streptomyces noursei]
MTLVQMQPRPARAIPVHKTVADTMDPAVPQVCDDMTIEVALSVMASARTEHLLICDNDGVRTALVTHAHLTAVHDDSAYTDRVQLRDILDNRGAFTAPVPPIVETQHVMRGRRLGALPVADEQGKAPGALAPAH